MEESAYVELEHKKKFSEKELLDIVADAAVEVVKQMKALPLEKYVHLHNFQDIFSGNYCTDRINLASCLVDKFGFKRIEYEQVFSVFGWPSIFHKGDWESDREKNLDYITDKVLAAGFSKKDDTHFQHQKESKKKYLKEHPEAKEK